jgi:DNA-binding NarL/FixJ family response regulator
VENDRHDLTVSGVAAASWREGAATIVLIERRAMYRECFSQYLSFAITARVMAFATAEEWLDCGTNIRASLIILVHTQRQDTGRLFDAIGAMTRREDCAPLFVLSDLEDDENVEAILRSGVRGHVSTNFTMDVIVKAVRLVSEGGVFAPTRGFAETRPWQREGAARDPSPARDLALPRDFQAPRRVGAVTFTRRQAAVIAALRKGNANKTIAYELKMCESTVKVHVRNIMKKLNARSRTEVAYLVSREGL